MDTPRCASELLLTAILAMLVAACGGADERPELVDFDAQGVSGQAIGASGDDVAVGPCNRDQQRTCTVQLPVHDGVKSCFVGVQLCRDGEWSECVDPADLEADAKAEPGG